MNLFDSLMDGTPADRANAQMICEKCGTNLAFHLVSLPDNKVLCPPPESNVVDKYGKTTELETDNELAICRGCGFALAIHNGACPNENQAVERYTLRAHLAGCPCLYPHTVRGNDCGVCAKAFLSDQALRKKAAEDAQAFKHKQSFCFKLANVFYAIGDFIDGFQRKQIR